MGLPPTSHGAIFITCWLAPLMADGRFSTAEGTDRGEVGGTMSLHEPG